MRWRARPEEAASVRGLVIAEQILESELKPLLIRVREVSECGVESAPHLHSGEILRLCDELDAVAKQISSAGLLFDGGVRVYNQAIGQFPTSILAMLGRFYPAGLLNSPEPVVTPQQGETGPVV
jgi:hypothetical protein